ncbi:MAG: DUF4203 domain-containing protein [Lachnotalea sp.]
MDVLKALNLSDIMNLLSGNYMEVISKYFTVIAVPVLVIAMINCFLGHRIFKLLVSAVGILIGAMLGAGICVGLNMLTGKDMPSAFMIGIGALVGAVVLGFASFKLYKAGAFFMGFITGVALGVVVMKLIHKDDYIIAGVLGGLLMGLLAIDLYKHMVILLTSVNGGLIGAVCIAIIKSNDDPIFILKMGGGLAIAGLVVQSILVSLDKKKKKNKREDLDEDLDEDSDEFEEDKALQLKKSAVMSKKEVKTPPVINKKKTSKKKVKNEINKKRKKKIVNKQKENLNSGIFLIDIITNIAQPIKDKIMLIIENREMDEIEEDELENSELEEDEMEDSELEDYELKDDELEADEQEENVLENKELNDVEYEGEELKEMFKASELPNKNSNVYQKKLQQDPIIIRDTDYNMDTFKDLEQALEQELEENITVPIFDVDEIGRKLEEELNNNLEIQEDEELENLIIKETIKNLDI